MPSPASAFSVVIPAYNEAALLPRLLDSLDAARAAYSGGAARIEVVVGNNASTDATADIARARGCTVVDVTRRTIAAARNGAARAARGDILCFVDADSIVHPETFNRIEDVLRSDRCIVGATGVKLERMSPGIAVTWVFLLALVYLAGVDTGVVFCRRTDFVTIGGYREEIIVAEDTDFLFRLKRLGRSRGQQFVRTRGARAIASTRKFDRHGDWHYLRDLLILLPLRLLVSRASARRFMLKYWYEDR